MRAEWLEIESALEVLGRAVALKAAGRPIVNLGVGQPDAPTPPHVCEAAIKAIREGKHGYTPVFGIPELRSATADYILAQFSARVDPERIVITPGGKIVVFFAAEIYGGEGTEILYPDPGFPIYGSVARACGSRPIPIPLREEADFVCSAEDIAPLLTERSRLLIVNSPHNPTGSVMSAAHWREIAALLADYPRVRVLSDEIYSDFLFDENAEHASVLDVPSLRERSIVLNGWSKSFAMTGWRLGWSVWPQECLDSLFKLAVNSYSCPSAPAQYAGIAALQGPRDSIIAMRRAFARRARKLTQALNALPRVSCTMPRGAFYVFPNLLERGLESVDVQERWLSEIDLATVAGIGFGKTARHHMRFSCAASDADIDEAILRLQGWFARTR